MIQSKDPEREEIANFFIITRDTHFLFKEKVQNINMWNLNLFIAMFFFFTKLTL